MSKNSKLTCVSCGQEMNSLESPLFGSIDFYHCGLILSFAIGTPKKIINLKNFTMHWEDGNFSNKIVGDRDVNTIWIVSKFHGEYKTEFFIQEQSRWMEPSSLDPEEFKRMFRQINKLRNFK